MSCSLITRITIPTRYDAFGIAALAPLAEGRLPDNKALSLVSGIAVAARSLPSTPPLTSPEVLENSFFEIQHNDKRFGFCNAIPDLMRPQKATFKEIIGAEGWDYWRTIFPKRNDVEKVLFTYYPVKKAEIFHRFNETDIHTIARKDSCFSFSELKRTLSNKDSRAAEFLHEFKHAANGVVMDVDYLPERHLRAMVFFSEFATNLSVMRTFREIAYHKPTSSKPFSVPHWLDMALLTASPDYWHAPMLHAAVNHEPIPCFSDVKKACLHIRQKLVRSLSRSDTSSLFDPEPTKLHVFEDQSRYQSSKFVAGSFLKLTHRGFEWNCVEMFWMLDRLIKKGLFEPYPLAQQIASRAVTTAQSYVNDSSWSYCFEKFDRFASPAKHDQIFTRRRRLPHNAIS